MTRLHHIKILIFRTCKALGLFKLSRFLMRKRLLILGYHGFQYRDEASFRPILFMSPETFARRMATINRCGFSVLPLAQAVDKMNNGSLPDNTVVITIDDGFYSVLDLAAPILAGYRFPSTLYVTSYYVSKRSPIFRLVIQYLFWRSDKDMLEVADEPWSTGSITDLSNAQARDEAIWKIIDYGEQHCDESGREAISVVVANLLALDYDELARSRALSLLDNAEMSQLRDYGIDVQLHTHRHRFPLDDASGASLEIEENVRFLSANGHGELRHFCYPSGGWNPEVHRVLESAGILSATTCEAGLNTSDTCPLSLYRILDQEDLTDIEFEAELFGFAELLRELRGHKRKTQLRHARTASPSSV